MKSSFPMRGQGEMEGGPMGDRDRSEVRSRGLPLVLGVLWSPAIPKRRRIYPRLLLPGHRRGLARRRGRHCAQQTPPGVAAIAACP